MMYVSVPDNEDSFFAYVNLVINNRDNAHMPNDGPQSRPNKIGPVRVSYTRNEVNELFFVVENNKEKCFIEMVKDQFCLLRSHWNFIESLVQYENSDKY